MKASTRIFLFLLICTVLYSFADNNTPGGGNAPKNRNDSLVSFAKKFMHSADSLVARAGRTIKVYAKTTNKDKYKLVLDNKWPDSLQLIAYVVYFKERPVEYLEVPVSTNGDTYTEYANYFKNGRIIAYKITKNIFKGKCTSKKGAMSERTTMYYDTTGIEIKKDYILVDANNKPVTAKECFTDPDADMKIYKTWSELPLVRDKMVPDYPLKKY